jgi:hypothetical protein
MKKQLSLALRLKLVRHPGQTVLNIEFEKEALADWCLGLCLLKEGLIPILLVQERTAKGKLEIQLTGQTEHRTRTLASFESNVSRVRMTPDDLDYLLHFFLKYFRDGVAEVDHLDLDVESQTNNQDSTITFKVPESAQPLSAEEAKKRLGLG